MNAQLERIRCVDWLDRSTPEIAAVLELEAAVRRVGGGFCITRMLPGTGDSDMEYWASVWYAPNVSWTQKAPTPTEAAAKALAELEALGAMVIGRD